MKKTVTIPENLDEITVRQLRLYLEAIQGDTTEELRNIALFQYLLNIGKRTYDKIKPADRAKIRAAMTALLEDAAKFQQTFIHKGVKYGLIPSLEDITNGEYIDLDTYAKDVSDIPKFLAVLYRPITKQKNNYYEVEPYQGSERLRAVMEDVPASVYLGSQAFFLTLGLELSSSTLKFTTRATATASK